MNYMGIVNAIIELGKSHNFVVRTKNLDIDMPDTCTIVSITGSNENIKCKYVNGFNNAYSSGYFTLSIKSNTENNSDDNERVLSLIVSRLVELQVEPKSRINDFDYEGLPFIIYKFRYIY